MESQKTQSILYGTARSPFARRVRLALLSTEQPFIWRELTLDDLFPPSHELLSVNPLGLVPVYVDERGFSIFDSGDILQHVDEVRGPLWPSDQELRLCARRISSLAQGILTYAVRDFQGLRVKAPVGSYEEDNILLIGRALDWIENESARHELFFHARNSHQADAADEQLSLKSADATQSAWDTCVALDYLDLRLSDKINWRTNRPGLENLFAEISQRDRFLVTRPK